MQAGLGAMKVSRGDFWKMGFREFWALFEVHFGHLDEKITRADLDDLMRMHPDGGHRRTRR